MPSKNRASMEEMEAKIGRKIGTGETLIYIDNPSTGVTNAWHLVLGEWLKMRGDV